ncbi:hypothetical protein SAY87_016491 [Trapa incisa]|uniref:Protein TIC 20 n=2 Tax=Trapa TaxID=22665 RepID=A0AAN7M2Q8_TRANT|nr:hypothetical protein SAY87_016491 [Trapa incisa]KAK4790777.1 hypothetical protein SAY86_031190 [Trapa natans]
MAAASLFHLPAHQHSSRYHPPPLSSITGGRFASVRFPFLRYPSAPNAFSTLPPQRRRGGLISMSYSPTPATDRLISTVAYTLPFFNSLQYGRFLLVQYPALGGLFDPFLPLLSIYKSIPYASFVAFFALYLGVVRNPSFSHYVRFNSMQAVTLDVLLVIPLLIQRIFTPGRTGLGFRLMVWGHNAIFIFSVLCFLYSVASSILGRTPYLPIVADAAGRQL